MTPDQILADPAASSWLKTALASALERDPVDAANDAEILVNLLARRAENDLEPKSPEGARRAPAHITFRGEA